MLRVTEVIEGLGELEVHVPEVWTLIYGYKILGKLVNCCYGYDESGMTLGG